MAYLDDIECGSNFGNTGLQDCVEEFGRWKKIVVCDNDFEIANKATALLEATWTTAINAGSSRIYVFPGNFNFEGNQEDRVEETGWGGESETVREGKDSGTFRFEDISLYDHKALRTHNTRRNPSIYIFTANGYILAYTNDVEAGKFLPQTLSDFYVTKRTISDGDTKDRSGVYVKFADPKQWNDKGVWVKPTDWDPLLLQGVIDCRLSGTVGATGMLLTVKQASNTSPVTGLIAANFNFSLDSAPTTPIAVTVSKDNGDGTFTLTWADQSENGDASFTLFGQPIGLNGYEAVNTLTADL